MRSIKFPLFLFLSFFVGVFGDTDKIVCYLGSWANYRLGDGKFIIEDIDPRLCTHAIYGFVGLGPQSTIKVLDPWLDLDLGGYKRFNALKEINPNLKTLVAIGGWNEGSAKYSQMAADSQQRANFIKNSVEFVTTHGFDGLDLDWEYPSQRGGKPEDKENFATLVKEMRIEYDKHGYLLSAAVGATQNAIDISYDVPIIAKYLHFINIMAYDLHGAWDPVTGINAPLFPSEYDVTPNQKQLNVEACVNAWIQSGADPEKIVLGMPVYGRTFTLTNPQVNGLNAPASGPGQGGPWTSEPGMLGFNEICYLKQQGGWTDVWKDDQQVPYSIKGNQWVGYDDDRSITKKVEFALKKKLAGVMIWSIETDDFRGLCGNKYPILNSINEALGTIIPTTTGSPTPTTEPTPPTEPPQKICENEGFVRDPDDCGSYYVCTPDGMGGLQEIKMHCPGNLYFDTTTNTCNYPNLVDCPQNPRPKLF